MITPSQKLQIDDWLRQADKRIREGRYIAADELLQKVFKMHPENTTALTYQDRIQFLVHQLSQRTGLQSNVHMEIRQYRDLVIQRKSNQINTYLLQARHLLEGGNFDKAGEQVSRVLAIDANNSYAKELDARIRELRGPGEKEKSKAQKFMYRTLLKESWTDGLPTEAQQRIITSMSEKFNISPEQHKSFEDDVKSECYFEALRALWMDGGLVGFTDDIIAKLMEKYTISRMQHSAIESKLLSQVRRNKVRGTILFVIGDNELLREMTYKFRMHSYSVIAAIDVEEALESMKLVRPEVVVSSMEFSGGATGFDLFQAIRSISENRLTPFYFIAPKFDRTTLIIGKRLGVDDFFTEPVDYELLFSTLDGKLSTLRTQKPQRHSS